MTRYAIGDVQGCHEELLALVAQLNFRADRDQLWFVGDLVNRGPHSLDVLRYVRALGDNAVVVLGNHDLHLLAVASGARRKRGTDTLDEVLAAPDRGELLEWLISRPLAYALPGDGQRARTDLMVHAGLVPQWTTALTAALAREVESALRANASEVFKQMYGDKPDQWSEQLQAMERIRFTINVLTRIRVCRPDGRIDLRLKGKPPAPSSGFYPWFDVPSRNSSDARVVFGHWSALGLVRRDDIVGLDSGCVWGGALSAIDLDHDGPPVTVACTGHQLPGD